MKASMSCQSTEMISMSELNILLMPIELVGLTSQQICTELQLNENLRSQIAQFSRAIDLAKTQLGKGRCVASYRIPWDTGTTIILSQKSQARYFDFVTSNNTYFAQVLHLALRRAYRLSMIQTYRQDGKEIGGPPLCDFVTL